MAALLREREIPVRLVDLTAEQRSTESLIAELRKAGVAAGLDRLPVDHADAARGRRRDDEAQGAFAAPLVCFGPHASAAPAESMACAPQVDAMIVGEPEDAMLALAAQDTFTPEAVPSLTWRRGGAVVAHSAHGSFSGFLDMPYPAWDLLDLRRYRLPMVGSPYVSSKRAAVARIPATSAWRRFTRDTSSASARPRRSWTKSSEASASSA